jgi:hypothetical protein
LLRQQRSLQAAHINNRLPCVLLLRMPLQACVQHGVQPGVFCLGEQRAAELASMGYVNIAYNTDLSVLVNYTVSSMNKLKSTNFSI